MRSQIKLGRIFGIQIGLHYSWFLIALLIVYSLSSQFHATNPAWGDGSEVLWGGTDFLRTTTDVQRPKRSSRLRRAAATSPIFLAPRRRHC